LDSLTTSRLELQVVDSNKALPQAISVLPDHFVWVMFQPPFYVLIVLHHCCTTHMDQQKIDQIQISLQGKGHFCSELLWVQSLTIFSVWRIICSPHTSETPSGIG